MMISIITAAITLLAIAYCLGHMRGYQQGYEAHKEEMFGVKKPAYVCGDFHADKDVPDYCEGCGEGIWLHKHV